MLWMEDRADPHLPGAGGLGGAAVKTIAAAIVVDADVFYAAAAVVDVVAVATAAASTTGIEEVDAVVCTLGGTLQDPRADSQVRNVP